MIYVETEAGSFEWKLGDGRPYLNPSLIHNITASHAELEHIRTVFGMSVPIPRATLPDGKVIWFGDMAAAILINLVLLQEAAIAQHDG